MLVSTVLSLGEEHESVLSLPMIFAIQVKRSGRLDGAPRGGELASNLQGWPDVEACG